ncbi:MULTISPECIES: sugar nucleotide-binding protein [Cobetia]|uniref:dTDP-4-dehydrorhamnose reductase n=1 Tax=Cobetia crustatorum TaxID=553385 RepID=A0A558HF14_9GAMM|nr:MULTISPECIES: sugar nucleotide-binding protein [Cobetia]TVU67677.1 sugar nucleotide-binding protein [Cobetia crustatorum]
MKLLLLDAGHCLSLGLARTASSRTDLELNVVDADRIGATDIRACQADVVIVPPFVSPADAAPADVTAHAEAVEAVLAACIETDTPLVWCVADQMFEQGGEGLLDEEEVPSPIDTALRRVIATGDRIRAELPHHLIVRLGPLFGPDGRDAWLPTLIERLLAGKEIRAAEDVILCPTSVDAVAMALIGMLQQQRCGADSWGAYHLAGTEPISTYAFVSIVRTQLVTRLEGIGEAVTPGSLKALTLNSGTPLRRVLNCRRVLETFGVHQKPWRLELSRLLDDWIAQRAPTAPISDPT